MQRRHWTVIELIRWGTKYLAERGIENARLEIERMLAHALALDRVGLYLQFERPLTRDELALFRSYLERRVRREPLAYILGEWEFRGVRLKVDRRALVPRPETETLVEICLAKFRKRPRVRFVDLGTGCGNIAATLALELPDASGWALDLSRDAVSLAHENLESLGVGDRVGVAVADMRVAPLKVAVANAGLDLVVSNPPYLRPGEWAGLQPEITRYEPREALVAEPDGLVYYRAIARVGQHTLRGGGVVAVEIGAEQAREVCEIFEEQGFTKIEVHQDLAGKDRVVTARKPD